MPTCSTMQARQAEAQAIEAGDPLSMRAGLDGGSPAALAPSLTPSSEAGSPFFPASEDAPYSDPFYAVLEGMVVGFIEKAFEADTCTGCGGPTIPNYGCGC